MTLGTLFTASISNTGRKYDPKRSSSPVDFGEAEAQALSQSVLLASFNNRLERETRQLVQNSQKAEVAFNTADANLRAAIAAGDDVDELKKKRAKLGDAKSRAAKKVREKENEVYLALCKEANLSSEATDVIKILCNLNTSIRAKLPTSKKLDSLGDIVSNATKAQLMTSSDKSKQNFIYLLGVDAATAVEKNAKNKRSKEFAAKLWEDVDTKYFWSTKKAHGFISKSSFGRDYGKDLCRQWFLPSVLGKVAKLFGQLEIVDSVDENNAKANKLRDLLSKVESSEGKEREEYIKQIWELK